MMLSRFQTILLLLAALSVPAAGQSKEQREASKTVVKETNEFRLKHDLHELKSDKTLTKAAQAFADFMAKTEKYGHHADGRRPAQRVAAAGYEYCAVRENIAYRTDPRGMDANALANHFAHAWINSAGHRANMLTANVTDTGVAIASSDGKTFYAVQLFGRPESLAYQVLLTNATETPWRIRIVTEGESQDIAVPSRGTLKFQRCFPVVLNIVGQSARKQVDSKTNLVIVGGVDGPVIK